MAEGDLNSWCFSVAGMAGVQSEIASESPEDMI